MSRWAANRVWWSAGLAAVVATAAAQEPVTRFDRVTTEDGLPHSAVFVIEQDSLGFVWFGSQAGLCRWDGYRCRVYQHDPADPESLSSNFVVEVFEDRRGTLWVGSQEGLDRYDRGRDRFQRFRHHAADPDGPGSLSGAYVGEVIEDREGVLWVGTEGGLDRFDPEAGRFRHFRHHPDDPASLSHPWVHRLYEDREGELWVGTLGGLNRLDRETGECVRYLPDPDDSGGLPGSRIEAIQEDAEGRLWIATGGGLALYDRSADRFVPYRGGESVLSSQRIFSLHLDREGDFWVGSANSGLYRFPRGGGPARRYRHHAADPWSVIGDRILDVDEDATGALWISTYVGVSRYDRLRDQFQTYRKLPDHPATLSGNNVSAILQDEDGTLWIGTWDHGLNRVEREVGKVTRHLPDPGRPGSLPDATVTSLHRDRAGDLWVGTWDGLARWDPERDRFEVHRHDPADPHSLSANAVNEVYEDSAGRLWVTSLSGIDLLDRATGRFRHYRQPSDGQGGPDAERSIQPIVEDRSGTVWFGTTHGGFFRLDPGSEELVDYRRGDPAPEPLSSEYVGSLLVDRAGVLWVGTRRGLNRYDTESGEVVVWDRDDGLPDDAVLALLEDGDGRIWLSTNRGLSRFDPGTGSFQSFGADDGLQSDSFSVRSAYRGVDGELFFGGIHGFNAFYPDRVGIDPYPPPVHVTDFQLFNRPVQLREEDPDSPLERSILETRELVLDHRQEVLTFELAALHYAAPEQNRYAYRLEGFDDGWSDTTARRRFVTYTHLSPGRYVFRAKASNKDGVWNEEGTSIALTVLPAPWRSWWAYSLYALVLVTVASGWVRSLRRKVVRERQRADREHDLNLERALLIDELKSRNEELARFNYMVSHDLKSPLITIKNYLGLTRHDADQGDRKRVSHDLDRIETAAERMRHLLDDLFEFTRAGHRETPPQTVPLGEVVGEVVELLEDRIRRRGVEVRVADDLPVVRGDRQRLFLVFQNLLENALKFLGEEPSPRIEVGVRRGEGARGGEAVVFVRDNGIGVEPRYHEQIFGLFDRLHPEIEGTGVGLALVRRVLEVHGGRTWVESEGQGRGSTFCFTLPGR